MASSATSKQTLHARSSLRMSLTSDDSKVLGKITQMRREVNMPAQQYGTRKYKTEKSAWTPIVHKPSNAQMFRERSELITHWFDVWTDSQRKRFINALLGHCDLSQLRFMQNWFQEGVPLRHLDFTKVLPRFLSLYIFSFLDPRSLCRTAMVSWHWKFIAEQDVLWMPKCIKYGWYLPYEPDDGEYGAWKRHYTACVKTMDFVVSNEESGMYGTVGDGTEKEQIKDKSRKKKSGQLSPRTHVAMMDARPKWQTNAFKPKDLEKSSKALLYGMNPNDPQEHKSSTMFHDRWGITSRHVRSKTEPSLSTRSGLDATARKERHRTITSGAKQDFTQSTQGARLSETLEVENLEERRLMELVHQPWEPPPPAKRQVKKRASPTGGYPLPWRSTDNTPGAAAAGWSYPTHSHPRVIFISSRVPAAEILVDAVMFGVLPVVYEYEGTTLETLMHNLDTSLQGRLAQSIGVFAHSEEPGEMRIVHGRTLTPETVDHPEMLEFFEFVCSQILPPAQGGHLDIFVPLPSSESGMEIVGKLNVLTGMTVSAPTGLLGNYNHVNSEWLLSPEGLSPPAHYFCTSKLNVWSNCAEQVQEALSVSRKRLSSYFQQKHTDLVAQITGQFVFDANGQADIAGVDSLTDVLREALVSLGHQKNVQNPLEYLGRYLLQRSGAKERVSPQSGTEMSPPASNPPSPASKLDLYEEDVDTEAEEVDMEIAAITAEKRDSDKDSDDLSEVTDIEEDISEMGEEQGIEVKVQNDQKEKKTLKNTVILGPVRAVRQTAGSSRKTSTPQSPKSPPTSGYVSASPNFKPSTSMGKTRLTSQEWAYHPDKRRLVGHEVLSSEVNYMRTLEILRDVFVAPLKSALASNRGVLSAHNVQLIFSNALAILDISKVLASELKERLRDWSQHQCLGDVFIKFCTRLKAYTNYINNYSTILATVEKCMEQNPRFRAFLKRHERKPETKMLTLQEVLLTATRRIGEYITLLHWFQLYTPQDHADRQDLQESLMKLRQLEDFIQDHKKRAEGDRELLNIQNTILNSPSLLEANRYFLCQEDVAHLKPPQNAVVPELRIYQHFETLGLFLFNDALVITRRTTRHFPFERCMEKIYRFDSCVALTRLRIEEIPDSKYQRNIFKMWTPKRKWILQADSHEARFRWVSLIEKAVRDALDLN